VKWRHSIEVAMDESVSEPTDSRCSATEKNQARPSFDTGRVP
jgi:hypothetical protein